ncbi:MAG TPA: LuxR C-terminal-related transcriptional regulator [Parafilimonas sp.]|nr:LuxR C-terminal-related transcriptional regulator [Parafilimonas sp.]
MKNETTLPTNGNLSCAEALFEQKIRALEAIADKLPVVVIVLEINPMGVRYMSSNGLDILGFSLEKIKEMGEAYHEAFFNPEDIADYKPKILELINSADDKKFVTYFEQVRPSPRHDWKWYLSSAKVFMRNENGQPTHILVIASPVDSLHHITGKVNRLLEENNFLRRNQKIFASLTKREKEILKLMALGESSLEIGGKLNISEQTASTHRRNIKAKLNAESNYDVVKFAQAFDLI